MCCTYSDSGESIGFIRFAIFRPVNKKSRLDSLFNPLAVKFCFPATWISGCFKYDGKYRQSESEPQYWDRFIFHFLLFSWLLSYDSP